ITEGKMNRLAILVIGSYLCFWSCGNVPDIRYYLIEYPLTSMDKGEPKYDFTLGVEKFTANALYNDDRFVYRESPYEARYDYYRRWITPPAKIVTEKVLEHFKSSGLFQRVVSYPHYAEVDYLLRGHLKAFEEWDEGEKWYARVILEVELINMKTQQLVWRGESSKLTLAARREPSEVVKAMSISLKTCIEEILMVLGRENQIFP
ncbi:MAG: ABC-type transport auxiliary lipoprotein family protein, partial [candidate division KSB1 bacterium]|nr:ABC-type transport auxiliary lipoprotein family protein [candidate division KSB1 bacterium]